MDERGEEVRNLGLGKRRLADHIQASPDRPQSGEIPR